MTTITDEREISDKPPLARSESEIHGHENEKGNKGKKGFAQELATIQIIPLYIMPRQLKQSWDSSDPHLDKNWGDIFFDLFYVAAAYNLGYVLKEDPTPLGFLYFMGSFFPVYLLWVAKLFYDARFTRCPDLVHKTYETAIWLALASSVSHIRPVGVLSHPSERMDMFMFAISITCSCLLIAGRSLEVAICQAWLTKEVTENHTKEGEEEEEDSTSKHDQHQGDHDDGEHAHGDSHHHAECFPLSRSAFVSSCFDAFAFSTTAVFSGAATIYAGLQFFGKDATASIFTSTTSETTEEGYHRFLATEESSASPLPHDNVAIWLTFAGAIWSYAVYGLFVVFCKFFKIEWTVAIMPMNINYVMHRDGEMVMLMMGETVLSLLIVAYADEAGYYHTFYSGLLCIVLLEYLHFRSQPSHPQDHALRCGLATGLPYLLMSHLYASSLIILGASFKMMLLEYTYEESAVSSGSAESSHHRSLIDLLVPRSLSGGASAALRFSTEDRQQRIAYFYCGSMAAVWLLLDAMIIVHHGIGRNIQTFFEVRHRLLLLFLLFLRVALIAWFATMSLYITGPKNLAQLGVVGIVAQLVLRIVVFYVMPRDKELEDAAALDTTLQYANARLRVPNLP